MAAGETGADELLGRTLGGRYKVTAPLGRGGMGVVCRAVDELLGREVAVKVLRAYSDVSAEELAELRTRMQREARAAARIRHTGVVTVHDVADEQGRPVIVMELVDGPSLDDVLRERGTLEPREAAALGAKVMDALDAAHRAGVLHRDVKPGNVLLERGGRVVLTDFGIASMESPGDGAATQLTRSGELVGSLDFLPPERAQGEEPGPASDVWSLGMTLYAAVEGAAPFRRPSVFATLTAIVTEPLPAPRRAGALGPVLVALLAKDPAARPTAEQARAMLQAVAGGRAPEFSVPEVPQPPAPLPAPPAAAFGVPPAAGAQDVPFRPPAPPAAGFRPPPGPHQARAERPTAPLPVRRASRRVPVVVAAAVLLAGAGAAYALAGGGGKDGSAGPARSGVPVAASSDTVQDISPGPGKEGLTGTSPSAAAPPPAGARSASAAAAGAPRPGTRTVTATATGPAAGGGPATGGTPAGPPACSPIGGGKYDCTVWRTADSYYRNGTRAGTLYAGTDYFYCQADLGRRETYGQWTNVWWAKTDDDSHNTGVYVSDVYLKGGANDQPVPGLPVC